MLDYLSTLKEQISDNADKRKQEHGERLKRIRSGQHEPIKRVDENGTCFLVSFGVIQKYHAYDLRGDSMLRGQYHLSRRASFIDNVQQCKEAIAKHTSIHRGVQIRPENILLENEQETIEIAVEQADKLAFGDEHHRLLSREEYALKYPTDNPPLTNGCYVEITLFVNLWNNGQTDFILYTAAGRFIEKPDQGDLLFRDEYFTSLPIIREDPEGDGGE